MASKIKIAYVKEYELCDWDHFYIVKGISILAALVAYYCTAFLNIPNLQYVQQAAATVFVLCSGYGVSESYNRKGGLIHYWENKMIKVWLPSLVVMIGFSFISTGNFVAWIASSPLAFKGNLLYVIFGGYAAFWVMFQFSEKKTTRLIGLFVISVAVFCFLPEGLGVKTAVLAFPVGVMFSQLKWKYRIRKFTWKGSLAVSGGCAAVATVALVLAGKLSISECRTALLSVSYIAIGALLILETYFLRTIPVWGVFVPFGYASYALYLLYDSIMVMMKGQTDWRAIAIIALLLCVAAAILTALRELLIAWNRKLRRRKNPRLKGSM